MLRHLLSGCITVLLAVPAGAQDFRFTRELRVGDRIEIQNINGGVEVSQGSGRTAVVEVTRTVRRGNGDLVKAIMEESAGTMRVCTIFVNRDPNRSTCRGENSIGSDRFDVEMKYVVRVPTGVIADINSVNGSISLRGLDTPASAQTVNGGISFEAAGASRLQSVNGGITARITRADWSGTMEVETVNGGVQLTMPASTATDIRGETVNGSIDTDFDVTVSGRWGPKSFRGSINGGGGRSLRISTVNGGIKLRKGQ